MLFEYLNGKVIVKVGDLTEEKTDAIVNAANWTLLGGGGVDGAIHSKGGIEILNECKIIRETRFPQGLPSGEAVITTAGKLPSKFVIHTVGPVFGRNSGRDDELLANSYKNSLAIAAENDLSSISFPAISTGAFYFPKNRAALVASAAIKEFLENPRTVELIYLVFFSNKDAQMFGKHQVF